jgi:hypothetical protein
MLASQEGLYSMQFGKDGEVTLKRMNTEHFAG